MEKYEELVKSGATISTVFSDRVEKIKLHYVKPTEVKKPQKLKIKEFVSTLLRKAKSL